MFLKSIFLTLIIIVTSQSQAQNADLIQVAQRTYGGNIYSVDPNSSVGRYLAETNAQIVIRRFLKAPVGSEVPPSEPGEEKLVVAVSARSFESFRTHLTNSNLFYHYHYPNQGTLHISFNGSVGNYARLIEPLRFQTVGTLLIPILLTNPESERINNYFNLGARNADATMYPWLLTNDQNQAYSPVSGWTGCTFWFGNIPMGDRLVNSYVMPSGVADPYGERPNIQELRPYTRINTVNGQVVLSAAQQVWTVPGHEQLADVLDLRMANLRGEFANPGWVAYTLLGSANPQRVPVVFLYVENELQPIDPNFNTMISPAFTTNFNK